MYCYSCDAKKNVLHNYSSFQCHVIFLEIITIYLTQETFLIITNVENNFAASFFCVEIVIHCIFQNFCIHIQFNEQHLFAFIKYIHQIC